MVVVPSKPPSKTPCLYSEFTVRLASVTVLRIFEEVLSRLVTREIPMIHRSFWLLRILSTFS
jgi:hypothetical protein